MAEGNEEYKRLLEAALFVTSRAMSASELGEVVGIASVGSVASLLDDLTEEYNSRPSALGIFKIGDKYIMSVKDPYAGKVNQLAGAPDLSRGALRILAFVSKNEPVLQSSIIKSFGSASYDYIHELQEKNFLKAEKTGRTKKLDTTEKFKEYFNF
jgi:segregation and condensation protein B